MIKKKNVVISASGGLDSSTLLLRCLNEYENVVAISFDYGQKHRVELERITSLVDYVNRTRYENNRAPGELQGSKYDFTPIKHQIIKLDGLSHLLNSTLVEGGSEVPEGHYAEENQRQTVVPNRNKMFASIVQAVALSIADKKQEDCDIALGIHAGDFGVYPDCRQEFRDADDTAFRLGNWGAERVHYFTPYLRGDKYNILKDGEILCDILGLDFDEVYSRTNTSYKPYPSGNSDYLSAASVERVEAFLKLGRKDPVQYEDEEGLATWDKVVASVTEVLENH